MPEHNIVILQKLKTRVQKAYEIKTNRVQNIEHIYKKAFFHLIAWGSFFFCFNFFDFSQLLEPKLEMSAAYVRVAASCHLHHRFDLQQHLFGSPSVVIRGVNTYVAMFSFTGQLVDMN